jgi:profilin
MSAPPPLQSYVDRDLVGSRRVSKAAIFTLSDNKSVAASSGFSLGSIELQRIREGFDTPLTVRTRGIVVAGTNYTVVRADSREICAMRGAVGCVCARSTKHFLVALYDESCHREEAAAHVLSVAAKLTAAGL